MRLANSFVVTGVLLLIGWCEVRADEPAGVVTSVRGSEIKIKLASSSRPNIGDQVRIVVDVPEVGEAEVGIAEVTQIEEAHFYAQLQKSTGKVKPGQGVRVVAKKTPPAPPVPPIEIRVVIVRSDTAKVMSGSKVVGQVQSGQRLSYTQSKGDWYLVEFEQDGRAIRGWIQSDHVRAESSVPSPDEVVSVKGWGTLVDPAGGTTVAEKDGGVEITVPGVQRDLWPQGIVNAPRLLSSLKGDFAIQVKVTSPVDVTGHDLARDAKFLYRSAVLMVWMDQKTFVRLERASSKTRPHRADYQTYEQGERTTTQTNILRPNQPCWLRIQRKAGTFYAWYRQEGDARWTALEVRRLRISDEVQVGVSLVNTTNKPFTATFKDFVIERN